MKKYVIIALIIIVVGLVVFLVIKSIKKKIEYPVKQVNGLKYVELGFSVGYAMNSQYHCRVERKENSDKYIVTYKPNGVPEEDKQTTEIDKEDVKELIDKLNEYNIGSWNGFQKSDKYVLDGDSFHLYLDDEDDYHISASGYMMWPKNYGEVKGLITGFCQKYFEEKENNDD